VARPRYRREPPAILHPSALLQAEEGDGLAWLEEPSPFTPQIERLILKTRDIFTDPDEEAEP